MGIVARKWPFPVFPFSSSSMFIGNAIYYIYFLFSVTPYFFSIHVYLTFRCKGTIFF